MNEPTDCKKRHTCEPCHESFATEMEMSAHLLLHTGVIKYYCPVCSKACDRISDVCRHIRKHNVARDKRKCSSPDKTFESQQILRSHRKVHEENRKKHKKHRCGCCKNVFLSLEGLKQHEVTHRKVHEENRKKHKKHRCGFCNNVFLSLEGFKQHEVMHAEACQEHSDPGYTVEEAKIKVATDHDQTSTEEEKRLTCATCHESFATEMELLHTGVAKYSCPICKKEFKRISGVCGHMRIHGVAKDKWKCLSCDKSFESRRLLMRHRKVHDAIGKTYKCGFCNYVFLSLKGLKQHEVTHAEAYQDRSNPALESEENGHDSVTSDSHFSMEQVIPTTKEQTKEQTNTPTCVFSTVKSEPFEIEKSKFSNLTPYSNESREIVEDFRVSVEPDIAVSKSDTREPDRSLYTFRIIKSESLEVEDTPAGMRSNMEKSLREELDSEVSARTFQTTGGGNCTPCDGPIVNSEWFKRQEEVVGVLVKTNTPITKLKTQVQKDSILSSTEGKVCVVNEEQHQQRLTVPVDTDSDIRAETPEGEVKGTELFPALQLDLEIQSFEIGCNLCDVVATQETQEYILPDFLNCDRM